MFFASDNGLGASDKVMQAISAANGGARLGYGNDDATKAVVSRLCDLFEREVGVYMVATGTAAKLCDSPTVRRFDSVRRWKSGSSTPAWGGVPRSVSDRFSSTAESPNRCDSLLRRSSALRRW